MDDTDKLAAIIQKLSAAQIRQLTRFAEFIAQDELPDPIHDHDDTRARYDAFKQLCQAWGVDLSTVETWIQETSSRVDPRGANPSDSV